MKKHITLGSLVKQYNDLEDCNDHNGSALLLVNHFGTDDEKFVMKGIIKRHKKLGHMTWDDIDLRFKISQKYYKTLMMLQTLHKY